MCLSVYVSVPVPASVSVHVRPVCVKTCKTLVKCIKISNSKKKVATALMNIVAVVQKSRTSSKFRKGAIVKVVLLSTGQQFYRKNGRFIKTQGTTGIILNEKGLPSYNKVRGLTISEVRQSFLGKLMVLVQKKL